ncbi:MAG: COX15/CtaA family protein [Chthoniobacteraceae bacterium]
MNARRSTPTSASPGLALFARLVVLMTFVLLFTGGHTTTAGAGMAFPDWPLSNGSLNPTGWLTNFFMFLEHSHRLTAGLVATMVAVLFAWVFWKRESVIQGALPLAGFALLGVLAQAVLGGLRVILDPQGIAATTTATATTFRVLHGCVAQIELCLLVALAALLSPAWNRIRTSEKMGGIAKFGRAAIVFVFLQLIVGATMRHLGAGLAIPTFPHAAADGSWMPKIHNPFVDLNFTHTRIGSIFVTLILLHLGASAFRKADGDPLIARPALLLGALILAQFTLGMFVIWHIRPPLLTTLHVVNGAAVLATCVLLTVRASRASCPRVPATNHLVKVAA